MEQKIREIDVRREAWSILKSQTLVGRVNRISKSGNLIVTSEVPCIHEAEQKPFRDINVGASSIEFKKGDLVSFRLTSLRVKGFHDGESIPLAKISSINIIQQEEFDSLLIQVRPLIEPYVDAINSIRLIDGLSTRLDSLQTVLVEKELELQQLDDRIGQASRDHAQRVLDAESLAQRRSDEIVEMAQDAAAAIRDEASTEHRRSMDFVNKEISKVRDELVRLEEQREIFRSSGGERFVRALGYDYRKRERNMEIIPKPENLIGEIEKELTRIGIDLSPSTLRRMVTANVLAAMTGQIVLYVGPPGSGKSTSGVVLPSLLGMKSAVIPVRPGWLDATDLLGYFDPRNSRFVSAPFVDFLIEAKVDADIGRYHTVVLDEMNLARIENYGADLISQLEKAHERGRSGVLRLYSTSVQREIDADKVAVDNGQKFTEIPAEISIPQNLVIAGTLNNDESTEALSQKVVDRCLTVRVPRVLPRPRFENGLPPSTVFTLSRETIELAMLNNESDPQNVLQIWDSVVELIGSREVPGLEDSLSQRFARVVVHAPAAARVVGLDAKEVVDDILSLKILPWIRFFRSQEREADENLRALASDSNAAGFTGFAAEIVELLAPADDLVHYMR